MKTITIKKTYEFSENSEIYLNSGTRQIHIKGFGSFSLTLEPGEEFFASYLWTRSNKITYEQLTNNYSFIIKPKFGKLLAFLVIILFVVCFCIFIFSKSRWSFLPLTPIVIYVFAYLSILKNRYLIIEPSKKG
jgi:predicted RND superfamily exporter protein